MPKMNVRKGDTVQVLSGKDRGAQGRCCVPIPVRAR